jgi:uncharacterized protein
LTSAWPITSKKKFVVAERPVVSNTTPLISLVGVGLLDLLPQLYASVWIPEIVRQEYQAGAKLADPNLDSLSWVVLTPVIAGPDLLKVLDAGEAAAITLATATNARAILLDEADGRTIALQRGLPVVGTIAVVLRAKQAGLIPLVRPVVDAMIARGGTSALVCALKRCA